MSHPPAKQIPETKLEPRLENGKALLIAGLRKTYTPAAMHSIPMQWQTFAPHLGKIPGQIGGTAYGICWQADSANIEYLSGVEVSGFAGMPDDFTVVSLPATKYAVFPHRAHVQSFTRPALPFLGGCRNLATNLRPQLTLKHLRSSNVIVKNSIRGQDSEAWKFGFRSNRDRVAAKGDRSVVREKSMR